MAIQHIVDTERKLVTLTGAGNMIDAQDSAGRLLSDSTLSRDFSLLFLVEQSAAPEPGELMVLIELMAMVVRRFDGRIAVSAPLVGQLTPATMVAMMADDGRHRIQVFVDEAEARAWVTAPAPA